MTVKVLGAGWGCLLLGRVVTGGSIHMTFGLRLAKNQLCVSEKEGWGWGVVAIMREWRKMKAPHLSLVPPPCRGGGEGNTHLLNEA